MTVKKSWIYPWVNPWSDRKGVANGFESAVNALNPYAWYSAEYGQPKNVGYVQLDGTSGDYVWTADSVTNDISGNIEVVMRVKATDWTAAANQTLAGKYVTTSNQRSWRFYVSTTGSIVLTASSDGIAVTSASIVPTVALVDNTWYWLRMRLQLTNGANSVGTLDIAADQAEEPTVWTANGSQTAAIITSVFNSTAPVEIGSFQNGTSERFAGQVSRCIVRDGFGGEVLSDFDARRCYGDGYYNDYLDYGTLGNHYVPLMGRIGEYIYCADSNALDITGDIDLVVRVQAPNYATGAQQSFIIKEQTTTQRSFRFVVGATGLLNLTISIDGSTTNGVSSDAPGLVGGTAYWLRVTRTQVDGVTKFYSAADQVNEPTTWTQIGADKTLLAGSAIFSSTSFLSLGIRFTDTEPLRGRIYRAIVRNGVGGSIVADFNANLSTPFGYGDVYGNGWVINSPKHKGNWTVGLPKIYDRSANNRAPVTFGAGTNSPKYLPYKGFSYVALPGIANNQIKGQYPAGLASVDTWEASLRFIPEAVGVSQTLCGSGSTHFTFRLDTSNRPLISVLDNLAAVVVGGYVPLAIPNLTVGAPIWIRGRLTYSTGLCEYWYSFDGGDDPDKVNWISLGSGINSTSANSAHLVETSNIIIGSNSTGLAGGAIKVLVHKDIRSGSGVTRSAIFKASNASQSNYTKIGDAATGSIDRATTGRKTVVLSPAAGSAKAVVLLGTDDYADVPAAAIPALDANAASPTSFWTTLHRWDNPGTISPAIFSNKSSVNNPTLGTALRLGSAAASDQYVVASGDGVNSDVTSYNGGGFTTRDIVFATVGLNSSNVVEVSLEKSAVNGDNVKNVTATTTVAGPGRIGAYTGGSGFIDMEFEDLGFFNSGLTSQIRSTLTDLVGAV